MSTERFVMLWFLAVLTVMAALFALLVIFAPPSPPDPGCPAGTVYASGFGWNSDVHVDGCVPANEIPR